MKTFVIGDIHGAYKALLQCIERSSFDYHKDRLVVIGVRTKEYWQSDLTPDLYEGIQRRR